MSLKNWFQSYYQKIGDEGFKNQHLKIAIHNFSTGTCEIYIKPSFDKIKFTAKNRWCIITLLIFTQHMNHNRILHNNRRHTDEIRSWLNIFEAKTSLTKFQQKLLPTSFTKKM